MGEQKEDLSVGASSVLRNAVLAFIDQSIIYKNDLFWKEEADQVLYVFDEWQKVVLRALNDEDYRKTIVCNQSIFLLDNLPSASFSVLMEGLEIFRRDFNPEGRGITSKAIKHYHKNIKNGLIAAIDHDVSEYLLLLEAERFVWESFRKKYETDQPQQPTETVVEELERHDLLIAAFQECSNFLDNWHRRYSEPILAGMCVKAIDDEKSLLRLYQKLQPAVRCYSTVILDKGTSAQA